MSPAIAPFNSLKRCLHLHKMARKILAGSLKRLITLTYNRAAVPAVHDQAGARTGRAPRERWSTRRWITPACPHSSTVFPQSHSPYYQCTQTLPSRNAQTRCMADSTCRPSVQREKKLCCDDQAGREIYSGWVEYHDDIACVVELMRVGTCRW